MKKFLKILGGIILTLFLLVGAGLIYFVASFPKMEPASNIKIEATPARLARGEYLANHVTGCFYCHSERDYSYYSGIITPGTKGKGRKESDESIGKIYIPNITPVALGNWTDGEVFRAITGGVSKDGQALFPMMPYDKFRYLAEEDVNAIIAYLRTLPPLPNSLPKTQLNFPLNLIFRLLPEPYKSQPLPAPADTLAYGKYLVNAASCHFCHTQMNERGQPLPGMDFAGGHEMPLPTGQVVRAANITPDSDTGIGAWDKAYFINRFKEYADSTKSHIPVAKDSENTVMPWLMYAGMTVEDLGAIYSYLRTLSPVKNAVEKHPQSLPKSN